MKTSVLGALAALCLSAAPAAAATLVMPNGWNNGNDGLMFDVKVGATGVTFESLNVMVWGGHADFAVFTYAGGITGHTNSAAGWTEVGREVRKIDRPQTAEIPIRLEPGAAEAGSTVGFYITTLNRNNSGLMHYDPPADNAVGAVRGTDGAISILSGYGKRYPYSTNYAGQSLVGSMTYSLNKAAIPEPSTWALMIGGFGLAGGMLRRRRVVPA